MLFYRFDGLVDGVVRGAPEPGTIGALAFALEDIGDGRALEPVLFDLGR